MYHFDNPTYIESWIYQIILETPAIVDFRKLAVFNKKYG